MNKKAIILYGPPAAGKDTVTKALTSLDSRYSLYRRLKVGPGRTAGYKMGSPELLRSLRSSGKIVWENSRYGATYVIDKDNLDNAISDFVPVLHLGQPDAVVALQKARSDVTWLVAHLWCPREIAVERIAARATGDTADRLQAWDDTPDLPDAALRLNTAVLSATQAAAAIRCVDTPGHPVRPSRGGTGQAS